MFSLVKRVLIRLLLCLAYMFLFGTVMYLVERPHQDIKQEKQQNLSNLFDHMRAKYNMTSQEFENFTSIAHATLSPNNKAKWSYFRNAIRFMVALCTTVGYGDLTPTSTLSRALTMLIALFGIPLMLMTLSSFGELFTTAMDKFIIFLDKTMLPRATSPEGGGETSPEGGGENSKWAAPLKRMTGILLVLVMFIQIGILITKTLTPWSYEESFYYWFITFTTIGFGDYIIERDQGDWDLTYRVMSIAVVIYMLVGLSIMTSAFSVAIELSHSLSIGERCFQDKSEVIENISAVKTCRACGSPWNENARSDVN
ncbi:predicted protein [Nematostella vectensis]|uniref:Potassium channel domain-containing protein n=1 Tax=Nematostella vectensis TaxID=45351 RepID=A7SZB8_NEMVE|nr:two pore potassium channel protein sup-9 [Nematostella vectensis]XP_048583403.1 two pore potassium channel protein sup-9 [Nematostella vectensis]EDO30949.1 predicted protein [Nematostella vectensis]|eukprot:XP_001623049.1 predicted protein [Nematostella vectensis]